MSMIEVENSLPPSASAGDRERVRVKICGVTNPRDAERAVALGADALGFNFYPGSARCLEIGADAGWLRELPPTVSRVGVLVNQVGEARKLFEQGWVHALQFHGDEEAACCQGFGDSGIPIIKAIRVRDAQSLVGIERFGTRRLLLDACRPGVYGGTGERFDWGLAERFVAARRGEFQVWLSGGLTPENVAEAVRRVRPYAVDVASGVEDACDPRRKDFARMRDFIQAAAAA